jgi:hypothetical protein
MKIKSITNDIEIDTDKLGDLQAEFLSRVMDLYKFCNQHGIPFLMAHSFSNTHHGFTCNTNKDKWKSEICECALSLDKFFNEYSDGLIRVLVKNS